MPRLARFALPVRDHDEAIAWFASMRDFEAAVFEDLYGNAWDLLRPSGMTAGMGRPGLRQGAR